jgi:flotillin
MRDSSIKQATYQADIDRAAAQAKLAGPLAEATARQQVVVEETKVAQLEAERREQELQVSGAQAGRRDRVRESARLPPANATPISPQPKRARARSSCKRSPMRSASS